MLCKLVHLKRQTLFNVLAAENHLKRAAFDGSIINAKRNTSVIKNISLLFALKQHSIFETLAH